MAYLGSSPSCELPLTLSTPSSVLLVADRFVSAEFLEYAKQLAVRYSSGGRGYLATHPLVWSLKQPFLVDLSILRPCAWVVDHRNNVAPLLFYDLFGCQNGYKRHHPYRGSALVQFEWSSLQEHQGTRTVVLRLVKFIKPLERTNDPKGLSLVPEPREGELIMKPDPYVIRRGNLKYAPWFCDLDKPQRASRTIREPLRLLLDDGEKTPNRSLDLGVSLGLWNAMDNSVSP
ncbi:hypothetical protein NEOLEDRAFT_1134295 [Neolentinus lepideus HHB14362 ss-1]|uniref:Uncharacterized protein n=1 Tax=Neolentinus lepideus HHB14362 ss-1 TaxID=1314782 RepID=A0A165SF08_9AGAM|nr:hypothetical protein NEOLEDRAFT_1134295 [Neolentinus lepideus HHB14362 ss-1]